MRTDSRAGTGASELDVQAEARRLQGAQGRLAARQAVRWMRGIAARMTPAPALGAPGQLELH